MVANLDSAVAAVTNSPVLSFALAMTRSPCETMVGGSVGLMPKAAPDVSGAFFASATNASASLAYRCFVHLRNDDELDAGLISCDAEQVVLDTSYAGKIMLPRSAVLAISPVPPSTQLLVT